MAWRYHHQRFLPIGIVIGGGIYGPNFVSNDSSSQPQLIQVISCFRHGARTPMRDCQTKPLTLWYPEEVTNKSKLQLVPSIVCTENEQTGELELRRKQSKQKSTIYESEDRLFGGALAGRLTRNGLEQSMQLGEKLRQRYVGTLLPPRWADAKPLIYVRSTSTERTIESAQGVVSGMYNEHTKDPVIIRVKQKGDIEYAVANFSGWCPRLNWIYTKGCNQNLDAKCDEVLQKFLKTVNIELPDVNDGFKLAVLFDQLASRIAANKQLPEGTEQHEDMMMQLSDCARKRISRIFTGDGYCEGEHAIKLVAGRMLQRITDMLTNSSDFRMQLLSAHDWTIIMLLEAFKPSDEIAAQWPGYCSEISVEKWQVGKETAIRVLLDGIPLTIPHLDAIHDDKVHKLYSLESFRKSIEPMLLHDDHIDFHCTVDVAVTEDILHNT